MEVGNMGFDARVAARVVTRSEWRMIQSYLRLDRLLTQAAMSSDAALAEKE